MKSLLLTATFFLSVTLSFAQTKTAKPKDGLFIVLYTIAENWDTTKNYDEQKFFNEHSQFLSQLRKTKKISLGGRYSDTGMIILKAKNETEANNLINSDLAIKNKIFKAEIFEFDPFYSGCVE